MEHTNYPTIRTNWYIQQTHSACTDESLVRVYRWGPWPRVQTRPLPVVGGASSHLSKGVLLVKFVGRGKAFFAYKNAFGTPPLHVRSIELEWFVFDWSDLFVPLGKETSSTIATFHFWSKIVYRPGGWGLLAFRAAAAACLFGLRLSFLFSHALRDRRGKAVFWGRGFPIRRAFLSLHENQFWHLIIGYIKKICCSEERIIGST